MPEKEFETKSTKPVSKVIPITSRLPAMEHLYSMKVLQQREGNAFVQRLLGKGAGGK